MLVKLSMEVVGRNILQLPLGLRPILLSILQRQHTRGAHHRGAATDDAVGVVVGVDQLQDSIGDWIQFTEFLLVTSLPISLPGKSPLPSADSTDDIHELIMGH